LTWTTLQNIDLHGISWKYTQNLHYFFFKSIFCSSVQVFVSLELIHHMLKHDMIMVRFIKYGQCLKMLRKLIFEVLKMKWWNLSNKIEKLVNFNLGSSNSFCLTIFRPEHLMWTWQWVQHYTAFDIWVLKRQWPAKKSNKWI
jgi:hypothetical protein